MHNPTELFVGNWVTYTASLSCIHDIPMEITVSEISKDRTSKPVSNLETNELGLEPPEFISVYFAPGLTQIDALAGLLSIHELLLNSNQERRPTAAVWNQYTGAVHMEWSVSAEEFFNPNNIQMSTNDGETDEGRGLIIVPLESGWTGHHAAKRLGSIRADIEEQGFTLGFQFLVEQDTLIFMRGQGIAVELSTDQI